MSEKSRVFVSITEDGLVLGVYSSVGNALSNSDENGYIELWEVDGDRISANPYESLKGKD